MLWPCVAPQAAGPQMQYHKRGPCQLLAVAQAHCHTNPKSTNKTKFKCMACLATKLSPTKFVCAFPPHGCPTAAKSMPKAWQAGLPCFGPAQGHNTTQCTCANHCTLKFYQCHQHPGSTSHWLLQACLAVLGPVVLVGGGACGNLPCPWPWLLARGAPWIATAFLGNTMHSQGQCQLAFKHRSSAHCPTPLAQLTTLALLALLVDGTHNAAATWPKQCVSI